MRLLLVAVCGCLATLAADKPAAWGGLDYLVGDWIGEGGGDPGQGSGSFSFKPDLQNHILVRTNHAEYPASKGQGPSVHDDLMIAYRDSPDGPLHAMYFDSEGHIIHYEIEATPEANSIVFISAPEGGSPRYRLTYTRVDQDHVAIKFEIAPADHPQQFTTYIAARAKRIKTSGANTPKSE